MSLDCDQMLAVLNALPDPVFVLTESGQYAGLFGHADPAYYHDGHELVGRSIRQVLPAEVADWVMAQIRQALSKDGLVKVEYPLSARQVRGLEHSAGPDGMIWFEGHIQPFPQQINGERAVIWVARNVTPRKLLEGQLLEASQTDPLTRAANRRRLLDGLESHYGAFRRYHHPMSMIMFDIDHFKWLNDRFGHLAGDEVLCCLCNICRSILRENDLLARFGGEEFIILLPSTPLDRAVQTAERIRTRVTAEVARQLGEDRQVTISLGVSELLTTDRSHEQIIQRVDEALYRAKKGGRDRVMAY